MLDTDVVNMTNLAKIIGISRTRIYQKSEKRQDYRNLVSLALAYLHIKQAHIIFTTIPTTTTTTD